MRVWEYLRRAFGGLYHCVKFGWNRCSSFDNMHVFRFRELTRENAYSRPNMGFFGG